MRSIFICFFFSLFSIIICCNNPSTFEDESYYNKNGIGPIKKLELAPINDSLMQVGKQLFNTKCAQCHTMEFKNKGPDISDILADRKPEWVLNFLLNKKEMLQKDSFAIITRKKYKENCAANINQKQEALELLEYLRIYQIWLHEFNAN